MIDLEVSGFVGRRSRRVNAWELKLELLESRVEPVAAAAVSGRKVNVEELRSGLGRTPAFMFSSERQEKTAVSASLRGRITASRKLRSAIHTLPM